MNIGCHLSSSQGYYKMGRTALEIGANTFQFFTRNPRGSKAKAVDPADTAKLVALMSENGFAPIVAHAPYTFNPCSADEKVREFTRETMADDLRILEMIPGSYYNFHPGCHVSQGVEIGIALTAEMLNSIVKEEQTTTVLIETMAGKGSEIGKTFEEIKAIIDIIDPQIQSHIGVCLDTCHINDGGYDVCDIDAIIAQFDSIIGIEKLKVIHLNDSKNELGAKKDRHEKLGQGKIPLSAIERIIKHPALRDLQFILETPNELDGYKDEIALLKSMI